MIRVLVVEDSPVEKELLVRVLTSDPDIKVVGVVGDGEAAIKAVRELKPDVVTMDICMPIMDGIEATRQIMQHTPTPIVIVTNSYAPTDAHKSFQAVEAGALTIIKKPVGPGNPDYPKEAQALTTTVRLMSEIKVVRRYRRNAAEPAAPPELKPPQARQGDIRVIAIGASTGGPSVIGRILSGLPKKLPVPILIVQHMTPGFLDSFVTWLISVSGYPIRVATHGELLMPGIAYFAPDDCHMTVGSGDRILLSKEAPDFGLRPSVGWLFRSVAEQYGPAAMGILLTGMGSDGARELKLMRDQGAVTVAQDSDSSVVFGMPGEAVRLGAAQHILDPARIVDMISALKKNGG